MKIRLAAFASACWFVTLLNTFAQGTYNSWSFQGVLTEGMAFAPPGSRFAATFAVNTGSLTPVSPGVYFPVGGYYLGAGSYGFGASSVGSGVLVANDQPANGGSIDGIVFPYFGEQSTGFPNGVPLDGNAYGVSLVSSSSGPTALPFTDTSFPTTLDLNQFSQRYMNFYFQGGGRLRGSVDSLYINGVLISQVPEPSSFGLLGIGVIILLLFFRFDCDQKFKPRRPNEF